MYDGNYHISLLLEAISIYRLEHSSVNGDMTIGEFIKTNCKDILDNVIELDD